MAITAPGRRLAERGDQRRRRIVGLGDQPPAGDAGPLLEGAQDLRFLLRAHAFQRAQPAFASGRLEILERLDPELVVEQRDGLRTDALEVEQVEDGRRKLLQEILVIRDDARVDELANLRGEVLADAGQGQPIRRRERGDAVGMVRDRFRGVAIRADLERVLVLDLEQVADFRQHACDCEVVHQECACAASLAAVIDYFRLYNASMSIRDIRRHAGQLALAGFAGHAIPAELRALAKEFDLGGVILFARNVESPEQVAEIAREAQSMAGELPLWVSVDQEGGRVARLRSPFTVWPPMQTLGRSGDDALAVRFAKALAAELRAVGVTLDFTPVLDILTNPENPAIGDRALATRRKTSPGSGPRSSRPCRPKASPPAASIFRGMATPAPTPIDEMPLIEHPPDRLDAVELVPFKRGDCRRRRRDHDGAHPGAGHRRRAAGDAVARRSSPDC